MLVRQSRGTALLAHAAHLGHAIRLLQHHIAACIHTGREHKSSSAENRVPSWRMRQQLQYGSNITELSCKADIQPAQRAAKAVPATAMLVLPCQSFQKHRPASVNPWLLRLTGLCTG